MHGQHALPLLRKAVLIFGMFRAQFPKKFMAYLKSHSTIPVLEPPKIPPNGLNFSKPMKDLWKFVFENDSQMYKCLANDTVQTW